jgi:hypothetical protein
MPSPERVRDDAALSVAPPNGWFANGATTRAVARR